MNTDIFCQLPLQTFLFFSQVKGQGKINNEIATAALDMLEIDDLGLDQVDRRILEIVIAKFNGGPVGLQTLAAATNEEIGTLEDIYEPFLMQLGFLARTSRGRVVTENAYHHLNIEVPKNLQETLL